MLNSVVEKLPFLVSAEVLRSAVVVAVSLMVAPSPASSSPIAMAAPAVSLMPKDVLRLLVLLLVVDFVVSSSYLE